jgi:predicted HD superfamily hydrolase involved in NAD metabolism
MKIRKIEKKLKKALDKERYKHTISVMYTAAAMAMAHDADIALVMYAGLLHDCAKCIPNDEKLRLCIKHRIEVTPFEQQTPFLLHAKLGAWLAQNKYKVEDTAILQAIRYHTTGAPKMSKLDKIIYIADYIEPYRDRAPNLRKIRELAFLDLDLAMAKILKDTLAYLHKNGGNIDPATEKAYEYYVNREDLK